MRISCHFRDRKALLVTSLTRVSGAIASVQTFTFVRAHVCLASSSIFWYWPKFGDDLWLGSNGSLLPDIWLSRLKADCLGDWNQLWLWCWLNKPPTRITTVERHFCHYAPQIWNSLPTIVGSADSYDSFKARLKTQLFDTIWRWRT